MQARSNDWDYVRAVPTAPSRQSSGDSPNGNAYDTSKRRKSTILEKIRQKYKYTKIEDDHTRILTVEPRSEDADRIDVSIMEVPFEDLGKPDYEYEALSYHWDHDLSSNSELKPIYIRNDRNRMLAQQAKDGDPGTQPKEVQPQARSRHMSDLVSNHITSKRLFVKPNLYQALRHLRRDTVPVTLWVDAICINQENPDEKHNQIARMDAIYSKAQTVLVWLGEGDERTKRAMAFIKDIINLKGLRDLVTNDFYIDDWDNLVQLMRRSWFSRRWVIQELAFASNATVHCGSDTVHWNDFRDAISIFAHEFDKIRPLFKRSDKYDNDFWAIEDVESLNAKVLVDHINNIFRKSKRGTGHEPMKGLEYLVSTLSAYDAGDPRDTVHAFSSIAKETYGKLQPRTGSTDSAQEPHLPPQVDYHRTLLQVYGDFVKWVAMTTGSIDIICRHWAIPEKTRESINYTLSALPSWIQQVSEGPYGGPREKRQKHTGRINGDSFVSLPGNRTYDASHGLRAKVTFNYDKPNARAGSRSEFPQPTPESIQSNGSDASAPQILQNDVAQPKLNGGHGRKRSHGEDGTHDDKAAKVARHAATPTNRLNVMSNVDRGREGSSLPRAYRPEDAEDSDTSSSSKVSRASNASSTDDVERAEKAVCEQLLEDSRDASMHVEGMIIGEVGYCSDPIPDGVIPEKAVKKLKQAAKRDDPDKLWRTLVAERATHGLNPPTWYQRACDHCMIHHNANGHINTKDLLADTAQPEHVQKFLKRVQGVIWNRCFIEVKVESPGPDGRSSKMQMHGFGPSKAESGDLVCILFGCSVPVLLRQREHPQIGRYYLFIGEAYVYGIMDGEAVSSLSGEQVTKCTKTFRLL